MAELLPLLDWLIPLIAAALCALAYVLAVPIINALHTGLNWVDDAINFLIDKAINLSVQFTQWLAPHFIENSNRIVRYFHQLGQLSYYAAHFAYRTGITVANYENWFANVYLPRKLHQFTSRATDLTIIKTRTIPLSKAQLTHLEQAIEAHVKSVAAGAIPIFVPKTWPKVNWTPKRWREWLGLGALGGLLALPGATAWEKEILGKLGKLDANVAKRLRKLNYLTAFAGVGALVAAGLAKIGLGWMTRCNNLKHIGPSFCGANLEKLIGLFLGLAALTETFNIVDFAKLVQSGVSEGEGLVTHFWQADVQAAARDRQLGSPT